MKIEAIILDIDGTLLNSQKVISPKTKEILIRAQRQGVRLILASGRPTSGMKKFIKELEMDQHHGLLVSYNGAKVIDCQTGEELYDRSISVADGQAVLEHLKQFEVKPMIDKDEYMYVNDVYDCDLTIKGEKVNIIQYESRGGNYQLCEKADLAEFLDYEVSKILTAGEPDYLAAHYKQMMAPFTDRLNCMFTADCYFEFTAKDIDKATALDTILKPLGIQQEKMIAFGDGHNDISMVRYAGIGVAMGNAVLDLKEEADQVTDSNDQDGIATVLETLL